MRTPVVLGLFLATVGFMIVVLKPDYHAGRATPQVGVEAVGPLEVYRPIPQWVGVTALLAGGALLVAAMPRRR